MCNKIQYWFPTLRAKWTHMMVVAVFGESEEIQHCQSDIQRYQSEIEEHQRYKENTKRKYLSIFDSAPLGLSFYDSKGF